MSMQRLSLYNKNIEKLFFSLYKVKDDQLKHESKLSRLSVLSPFFPGKRQRQIREWTKSKIVTDRIEEDTYTRTQEELLDLSRDKRGAKLKHRLCGSALETIGF